MSNTVKKSIAANFEMSGMIKMLNLGASIEASIESTSTNEKSTSIVEKNTYTIPAGDNWWLCQREVLLNTYDQDNAVQILDKALVVKGEYVE